MSPRRSQVVAPEDRRSVPGRSTPGIDRAGGRIPLEVVDRPAVAARFGDGPATPIAAAVEYYDDEGRPGPKPTFFQFPADPLLRGQRVLIVDEVWDSGTTIHAVMERVRQAGGIPTTAVIHYKPTHSTVPSAPDHHVVTTDRWVVYPFKAGR